VTKVNAVSGEDDVTVERKNITDWNGRLPGRFMVASNRLPNFGGGSIALATRLITLPFGVTFLGREDRALNRQVADRVAGILNWSLAGLAKLASADASPSAASLEAKTRCYTSRTRFRGFIEERCTVRAERRD